MGIASSLYSSISGLNTMGNSMGVLGDNVANVNTIAFKSSRATFQDVLSQSVSTAAGSAQVGRGVTLSTVDGLFAQGSFESTSTPTDLAIGGQGFFMLRAADNSAADMYTRAGEFRFDQEGFLVNPTDAFVQGWSIDARSGEVQGTIGDINLGKSTPPVATAKLEAIVNLDSREANETNELRLYDAWDGTNAYGVNPGAPIESENYEYTSSVKIYDSKGASHDISVYFDRTTRDNQWEFLVSCEPSEDLRHLDTKEQDMFGPGEIYDYERHPGAGALMYGVIDFTTAGAIDQIAAWSVPPDGDVDISLPDHRLSLEATDSYYSFESNFTGSATNQTVQIDLGCTFSGEATQVAQTLVSDGKAYSTSGLSAYINNETEWGDVYDASGNEMSSGDTISYTGYDNEGNAVSGQYVVNDSVKMKVFLDSIGTTFGGTATIDDQGRLKLYDNSKGQSGLSVTSLTVYSATNAQPFGGDNPVVNTWAVTPVGATNGTSVITDPTDLLTTIGDGTDYIEANDQFVFTGTDVSGNPIPALDTYNVTAASKIQDLMDFASSLYDGGTAGNVSVSLDGAGRIRVVDNTDGELVDVNCTFNKVAAGAFDTPWSNVYGDPLFTARSYSDAQVDVSSVKTTVVSVGRSFNSNTGKPPVIDEGLSWAAVYDESKNSLSNFDGSKSMTFSGTRGNGISPDPYVYIFDDPTATVRDMLDGLETAFNAEASLDGAGRLVLRDWEAGNSSNLNISSIAYGGGAPEFFGTSVFERIIGSSEEDGSLEGDEVSVKFTPGALSSTQYANSSTTIFQDQNGYAAGFLQSVSVDTEGVITGHYSNGQVLERAQVALASFNNLAGLKKQGGNIFRETTDSGAPVTGAPGSNGLGAIAPNSLEQSNVDLGNEFVKLITTQRGFQANSKIITTTDEMLADLINIKR